MHKEVVDIKRLKHDIKNAELIVKSIKQQTGGGTLRDVDYNSIRFHLTVLYSIRAFHRGKEHLRVSSDTGYRIRMKAMRAERLKYIVGYLPIVSPSKMTRKLRYWIWLRRSII